MKFSIRILVSLVFLANIFLWKIAWFYYDTDNMFHFSETALDQAFEMYYHVFFNIWLFSSLTWPIFYWLWVNGKIEDKRKP